MNTLVLIKPDAFARKLVGYIIQEIEHDFEIVLAKIVYMDSWLISNHYRDHLEKGYYNALYLFMSSGPTLALDISGEDVVSRMIELRDKLRISLTYQNPRNLIHSSDLANVMFELDLWFPS